MKTLAHEGSKSYKQQFDLLYLRDASAPNQIWQADHMWLDIFVSCEGKESSKKPWLTVIIDDYSRAIAGYELSFMSPSAMKTALCFRQGIWRKQEPHWSIFGIPSIFYTDHGSDFTSKHIEQVCISLKIQLIFSKIGKPRGRGKIERFFRTLNQMLLSEQTGYTGSKNSTGKLLTLTALDVIIRNFIIEYNQRLHPSINEIPKQRWEKNGFLPRIPDSVELLDMLLLTIAKPRKVMRDGIHFQGLKYLDPILAEYVGELVIIRYDPRDLTSIRVFYKDKFLCQPICHKLDQEAVSLKDIENARNERRKYLQNEIKTRLSLVDAILNKKQTRVLPELKKPDRPSKLKLYDTD